jgi:hypothetical protein
VAARRCGPHIARMVTTLRLYLLRATYLMIALFIFSQIWPALIRNGPNATHMTGVARCLLAALGPMVLLGLRYPLKMLPVMLFEFIWKLTWVLVIGLPLWSGHRFDPNTWETFKACMFGVVLCPIVIPWPYVWENYVKARGDRWRFQSDRSTRNATVAQ